MCVNVTCPPYVRGVLRSIPSWVRRDLRDLFFFCTYHGHVRPAAHTAVRCSSGLSVYCRGHAIRIECVPDAAAVQRMITAVCGIASERGRPSRRRADGAHRAWRLPESTGRLRELAPAVRWHSRRKMSWQQHRAAYFLKNRMCSVSKYVL